MTLSNVDVMLRAFEVLAAVLDAEDLQSAIPAARVELEVLDREDLLRVAQALAVEPVWRLMPAVDRTRLRPRLERVRAEVMWAGSDS